jgi:metallo-beta-lactamase family protein
VSLRLAFHGAAGTVTGSRFVVESQGRRVLVDCGLFQGLKELRELNWRPLPPDLKDLDAVILTHAHIDHSGYLPYLVSQGYRGPVYTTPATAELLEILLIDAARLQEEDADYANRKGYSKHRPALPLYTVADAAKALQRLRPIDYGVWFSQAGFQARFGNAGHILGSAFVEMEVGLAGGRTKTIVFSGDLGQYAAPLHPDPDPLPAAGTVVLESTYGDRLHDDQPLIDQIQGPFREAFARRGTVLIPAFAVARAQLMTFLLRDVMPSGAIPTVPIHIDSPMAADVTEVYGRYAGSKQLDRDVEGYGDRLFPPSVKVHRTVDESRELNTLSGPRIIVSSSGMLTGGRVLHHLRRLAPDPKNVIVLVGYQAIGTRGRALQDGAKILRVHGEDIPVRAKVVSVDGLSAHADRSDLERWLHSGPAVPKTVFLTHGEPESLTALAGQLGGQGIRTIVPRQGDDFEFDERDDRWQPLG